MAKEVKTITLRLDLELHNRVTQMLDEASDRKNLNLSLNYISQQLLRACCDEFERDKSDNKKPTFNAFVTDNLGGRRSRGSR